MTDVPGRQTRHSLRRVFSRPLFWIAVALLGACLVLVAGVFRVPHLGEDLVCAQPIGPSDAILVENFDPTYLVFERAAELRDAGLAPRVFVPASAARNPAEPDDVSLGILEVMARVARLRDPIVIPVRLVEPISLNAAYQIRAALVKAHVRSVIVVAPGFRSRRSALVYGTVFAEAGIKTSCEPVFGPNTPENWMRSWHGIEDVAEQYVKLQYYRLYVFPRLYNPR